MKPLTENPPFKSWFRSTAHDLPHAHSEMRPREIAAIGLIFDLTAALILYQPASFLEQIFHKNVRLFRMRIKDSDLLRLGIFAAVLAMLMFASVYTQPNNQHPPVIDRAGDNSR